MVIEIKLLNKIGKRIAENIGKASDKEIKNYE